MPICCFSFVCFHMILECGRFYKCFSTFITYVKIHSTTYQLFSLEDDSKLPQLTKLVLVFQTHLQQRHYPQHPPGYHLSDALLQWPPCHQLSGQSPRKHLAGNPQIPVSPVLQSHNFSQDQLLWMFKFEVILGQF